MPAPGLLPRLWRPPHGDTAAHLVDRVLPEVPIRQWVLTLPYLLRYRCAYDARLSSEVLRAFVRALFAELRRRSLQHWGMRAQQCGGVTFLQRFGSAMNLNLHFHTLALDGVYADARDSGWAPRFLPLPPPDDDEVARVLAGTARRLQRLVAVPARDRRRLQSLCRYVARPPLANDRLEELPDGRLALRLKTRWRDRVVPAGDAALAVAERKPAAETDGPIDHRPQDPRMPEAPRPGSATRAGVGGRQPSRARCARPRSRLGF